MAFRDFIGQAKVTQLLQRSLDRGRVAHGYLFSGDQLGGLEDMARTLAKTLNCHSPVRGASGKAVDCCDQCLPCRSIDSFNHADVQWVRPESKSRIISVDQMMPNTRWR
jgi:DNA polymerase-3 subunit delta'